MSPISRESSWPSDAATATMAFKTQRASGVSAMLATITSVKNAVEPDLDEKR
jgi:hypothetical protein